MRQPEKHHRQRGFRQEVSRDVLLFAAYAVCAIFVGVAVVTLLAGCAVV